MNLLSSLLVIAYPGMFALSKSHCISSNQTKLKVIFGFLLCKTRLSRGTPKIPAPLELARSVDVDTEMESDLQSPEISTESGIAEQTKIQ